MKVRRGFAPTTRPESASTGDDFLPTIDPIVLRLRAGLLRRVREFFDRHGFLEVETPILSADTVVDRHLDPFAVEVDSSAGCHGHLARVSGEEALAGRQRHPCFYLQTSPEFAMKRLLAAGAAAIYQVTRAFRRDELGPLHNPEFTMVEWYRVGDGPDEGMTLLSELAETLLERGPAERLSYREAFEQHVGLDPHTARTEQLVDAVREKQIDAPASLSPTDRDTWLDLLLVDRVQPHLGQARPTILYDYPAGQAALARLRDDDGVMVAERFELCVDGIELANGYHELTDADELTRRNTQVNLQRQLDGHSPLPSESRLLAAMRAGLPASTGVALGFDRVVMLAAGAKCLADVMPFPFDRA
ncbi:MAG: EF-P lysine aminoacylase GenX [Pirellulales bacterium]|nr:EF-P lysine aminoacylase GenX [Pirellulales bacterium]